MRRESWSGYQWGERAQIPPTNLREEKEEEEEEKGRQAQGWVRERLETPKAADTSCR